MNRPLVSLDYGRSAAWYRRVRWRRWGIFAVLIVAGAIGWQWKEPVATRGKTLYWQWKCLGYEAPVAHVVYDERPEFAGELIRRSGYASVSFRATPVAVKRPDVEVKFLAAVQGEKPRVNVRVPFGALGPAVKLWAWPRDLLPRATLFLHERRTPTGDRRLVIVTAERSERAVMFIVKVFIPATPFQVATEFVGMAEDRLLDAGGIGASRWLGAGEAKDLRFFAGRADPDDEAHFTIGYEKGGARGVIDGRVVDGLNVKLAVR